MRRCVGGALGGHGQVIEAAFDRIAAGERRVVLHAIAHDHAASGYASRLVWPRPLRGTRGHRDIAKALAGHATEHGAAASGSSVHAMGRRVLASCRGMISAASERITRRIGCHTGRKRCCCRQTAVHAGVLLFGASAIGHDSGAIKLGRRHHPAPTGSTRATAAAAAARRTAHIARAARRRRAGGISVITIAATKRDDGSRRKHEA